MGKLSKLLEGIEEANRKLDGKDLTEIPYMHSTAPNPYSKSQGMFGMDTEPAGQYVTPMSEVPSGMGEGYTSGVKKFKKPLVVNFGGQYGDSSNWKSYLSEAYDGKTGKELTDAIRADGYDGIVTVDDYGLSESVDLYKGKGGVDMRSKGAGLATGAAATGAALDSEEAEASFIGQAAKTFSKEALNVAKKMADEGASRDEIWQVTGKMGSPTFKDADGHWKQEISDKALAVPFTDEQSRKMRELGFTTGEVGNFLINKPLTEAYPSLKNIDVFVDADRKNSGGFSAATPDTDDDFGRSAQIDTSSKNNAADISVMSHELQHAIQDAEGFARGGSSKDFQVGRELREKSLDDWGKIRLLNKFMDFSGKENAVNKFKSIYGRSPTELEETLASTKSLSDIDKAIDDLQSDGFNQYKRLAGEAEARNVQTRLNYDMDERVNTPPWRTLDVPEDELIFRDAAAGLAAASAIPNYKEADETEAMATDFVDRRLNRPSRDRRKRREESRKAQALAVAKRKEALEAEAALDEMLRQADMSIDTIRAPVNPAYAAAADYVGKYNRALKGSPAEYLIGLEGVEDYLRKGAYGEADWVDRGMAAVEGAEVLAAPLVGAKAMGKITP